MKTIKKLLSITLLSLFAISCSNNDEAPTEPIESAFYAGGYQSNSATIWKNGIATALTNNTYFAEVRTVVAIGSDVYAAGIEYNISNISVAKVWKNGVAVALTDGTTNAYVNDMKVIGNDVYVVGQQQINNEQIATLWKNGVPTTLTIPNVTVNSSYANALAVVGNDVYVLGGNSISNNYDYYITVWKNGVPTAITDKNLPYASGRSIFVSGSDRCICFGIRS